MRTCLAPVLLASLAACSSSSNGGGAGAGAGGLDCAWLASDNCYKQTLAATASCLPAKADKGILSADGKTCTYPGGQVVTFDPPLVLPVPKDPTWNFTITSQGQTCLKVNGAPQSTFVITSSAGTFTENTVGLALSFTCPDGKSFSNSNALELLSCGLSNFPGTASFSSDTSVSLSLVGTSGGSVQALDCTRM